MISESVLRERLSSLPTAKLIRQAQAVRVMKRHERVELYRDDITGFKHAFLSSWLTSVPAPWHGEVETAFLGSDNVLIEAWRGSAKSRIADIATLHGAVYGRFQSKLLTSATSQSAIDRLRRIKLELETNKDLREVYGDLVSTPWNEDEIKLSSGVTIRAKGAGVQVRGDRYDEIDFDDSERDDKDHSDVASPEARDNYASWIQRVVLPTLTSKGRVRVLYTPLHPQSFWRLRGEQIDAGRMPGWKHLAYKLRNPHGVSNWPQEWPEERIQKVMASMDPRSFDAEFNLSPIADGENVTDRAWIKWFDSLPETTRYFTTIAVDCAVSKKETADYTAIVVTKRAVTGEQRGNVYVMESIRGRWTVVETVEQIYEAYRTYKPDLIGIPSGPLDKAIRQYLEHYFATKGFDLPIAEIKEDVDLVRRMRRVTPLIQRGKVYFQRGYTEDLVHEMVSVPNTDHDDMASACVNALMLQQEREYPDAEDQQEKDRQPPAFMSFVHEVSSPQRGWDVL